MKKYTVRAATPLVFAALLLVGACKGNEGRNDSALAQDSTLNRDLQLANKGDSAQQPQLQDVPAAPAGTSSPTTSKPKSTTKPSSSGTKSTPTTTHTKSGNVVTTNPSAGSNP